MKKLNKRGSVMLYITFIITALIVILIGAFFVPMGVRFNSALYVAGEQILKDSQPDIDRIQDNAIRTQLNETLTTAKQASADNIEVNAQLFRYSWILVIGLVALIIFIFTRRLTEINTGYV